MTQLERLTKIITHRDRICPQPNKWNDLWEKLHNKQRSGNGYLPPAPLILAAWHHSSDTKKKQRFIEHLEWAEKQGQLEEITDILESMTEDQWYHTGG